MIIEIDQAITILKNEGAVAVPTETVYGLAGIISSESALKKIFEIKKRPFFDPLIVHVENISQAQTLVSEWPVIAQKLAEKFWPGPLTFVLKKNQSVSDTITSGLERVGLRCPSHPAAQEILRKLKTPFAAPSANLFGRTSPTSAQHVETEFQSKVPVVDGGSSQIGIESTVLLIEGNEMAILRSGHVLAQDIEKVLHESKTPFAWKTQVSKKESPGHMKHHYMPSKPLFWIENSIQGDLASLLNSKLQQLPSEVEGVKLVKPQKLTQIEELVLPMLPHEAARTLYAELRRLGEGSADGLVFYLKDYMRTPEWEPVLERLKKASSLVL